MKLLFIVCVMVLSVSFWACTSEEDVKRFEIVDLKSSGIDFSNTIVATDTFNVIDFYYIYNGGGVGIGDFNNDGLQDVYFAGKTRYRVGSQTAERCSHRLYHRRTDGTRLHGLR